MKFSPKRKGDLRKIKNHTNILTEEQAKLPGRLWNSNVASAVNSGRYSKRNAAGTEAGTDTKRIVGSNAFKSVRSRLSSGCGSPPSADATGFEPSTTKEMRVHSQ